MERFIGEEEDFVGDTKFDWEPVKLSEDWGDVMNPGPRVLDIL